MEEKKDEQVEEEQEDKELEESSQSVDSVEHISKVEGVVAKPVQLQVKSEVPNKLVEQVKRIGSPIPGKLQKLREFIMECRRVIRVTKKPDKQEYTTIVKISAIGMALIGALGFIVYVIREFIV